MAKVDQILSEGNFVFGGINKIKSKLLLDTGASRSCVSVSFLKRLKMEARPLATGDIRKLFKFGELLIWM
jgi:hypothetical protein